jgi:uncharacterized ParB-like nuclease family protein
MTRQPTPDILARIDQAIDDLDLAIGPAAERISTVKVRLDGGTQPRAGISQAVVDDYYADMASGAQFPPIEVVFDGADYWLWDGFHRFHAWRKDGDRAILAHVRQGTRRDAVLLSVGANATHGFRRTNEDKRRAVMALLQDEEWGRWSDREIARRCAVSHTLVANLRAELSGNGCQIETRRVQRNGTEYTMATPQRSAAPAVAAQEGKWLSLAELTAQVRGWADVWEDPAQALRGLNSESIGRKGSYWDDWMNWIDGKYSAGMLGAAISAVLAEIEPVDMAERVEVEPPARACKPKPIEPWIVEELVEELVALESVALDGVDHDWLYEYMQGIAVQHNRTFGRRDFDFAMRMAVPRQRADNERRERLTRSQAAAMAADAERARTRVAPFVPVDIAEQVETVIDWRRTRGTITEDGRILVQMSNGSKNPPWLELDDAGQHWMLDMIRQTQSRGEL